MDNSKRYAFLLIFVVSMLTMSITLSVKIFPMAFAIPYNEQKVGKYVCEYIGEAGCIVTCGVSAAACGPLHPVCDIACDLACGYGIHKVCDTVDEHPPKHKSPPPPPPRSGCGIDRSCVAHEGGS